MDAGRAGHRDAGNRRPRHIRLLRRVFAEPLVHFLIAGGLLFATYGWLNPPADNDAHLVRITAADVQWIRQSLNQQRSRAPDEQELRAAVSEYLRELLLAREARSIGLDQNDTVIRRRLAQKMAFLVQDTASVADPDEASLRTLYRQNVARYERPSHLSFIHRFFQTETAARRGLEAFARNEAADVGEPSLLEPEHHAVDRQAVSSQFGPDFADRLLNLEPRRWQGPVKSAYGFHLVWINEHQPASVQPFESVRHEVLQEWRRQRQQEVTERFFTLLMDKYDVVVEEDVGVLPAPFPGLAL